MKKTPFEELCTRVYKIDRKAAKILRTEEFWKDTIPPYTKEQRGTCSKLSECFIWDATPQGNAYWSKIFWRLEDQCGPLI
jgi:hypothetical protein